MTNKEIIAVALMITAFIAPARSAPPSTTVAHMGLEQAGARNQIKGATNAPKKYLAVRSDGTDDILPTLENFSITGVINVQRAGSNAQLSVTARDNLSGVSDVSVSFESPSGKQAVTVYLPESMPVTVTTNKRSFGADGGRSPSFGLWSEAGDWLVRYVAVRDAAGNEAFFRQEDFLANGWSDRVTVINSQMDSQPPVLKKGVLSVTEASLADNASGTTEPGYVFGSLATKDIGEKAISGVSSALVKMCRIVPSQPCVSGGHTLILRGNNLIRDKSASTLKIAGQLARPTPWGPGNELGVYQIVEVILYDYAENKTTLTSIELGGTTDFKTLFDNTIFTLKP